MLQERPTASANARWVRGLLGLVAGLTLLAAESLGSGVSTPYAMNLLSDAVQRGWMSSTSVLVWAISAPLLGLVADRIGWRRVVVAGLLLAGVATLAMGLVGQPVLVIVLSGVVALGEAGVTVALLAYILAAVGVRWIWGTVIGALSAVSSLLSMWGANLSAGLLSTVDRPGSMSVLVGGIVFLVGAVVGGGIMGVEYWIGRPLAWPPDNLEPQEHPQRRLWVGLLLVFAVFLALAIGSGSAFSLWLYTKRLSTILFASISLVTGLVGMAAGLLGGLLGDAGDWLSQRALGRPAGRLALLLLGLTMLAFGIGLLPATESDASILLVMGLQSLGSGLLGAQIVPLFFSYTRPRRWTTVYGLYIGISSLGSMGTGMLYGQLVKIVGFPASLYIGAGFAVVCMAIPAAILYLQFARTHASPVPPQDVPSEGGPYGTIP